MMRRRSYANVVADWERTLAAIDVRQGELGHLGDLPPLLSSALEKLKSAILQQGEHRTRYRLASQEVQDTLKVGEDAALRLRDGIRMKYGRKAGELLDFGLQPLRPQERSKKKKKGEEEKAGSGGATESGS